MMRALVIAMALSVSGCATFWITTQAIGKPSTWDEGIREQAVPLPGVEERLAFRVPLLTEYSDAHQPLGFRLACNTDQRARDTVYHSAFRYGKRWKWMSGLGALAEGLIATALIVGRRDDKPNYIVFGGYLGIDAAITAALFFIPRKEIYRHDERASITPVRSDCPEGLTLAIGGERFPVDAVGGIGEQGESALDAWMNTPTGSITVEVAGQARVLEIGPGEHCVWQRAHHPEATCYAGVALQAIILSFDVLPGTLTGVAAQ
ncbi:hypothetical protein BH11MYX3_BH11MYX3_27120 [soil metagenome]